jgi:hypothetical protein
LALLAGSTQKGPRIRRCAVFLAWKKHALNMISYRLGNGKEGNINDPRALLVFYTRIFYEDKTKGKATIQWQWPRRRAAQQRTPA